MYPDLLQGVSAFDITSISTERKIILDELVTYISTKIEANEKVNLNFICTHNSRRSHLSQVWAQTMAAYYHIDNVFCYSGGTEATAMYPKVLETLRNQGFSISIIATQNNPIYAISYDQNAHPIICFSKKYDDEFNPKSSFGAIMTCSSADKRCPVVSGADCRISITYLDPKVSDNQANQDQVYMERSCEIATEMKYVFNAVFSSLDA